jgi:hypothetical protein
MGTIIQLNTISGERTNKILSGQMYYFKYEAEPTNIYYDRFPLVFVVKKRGRLFEGINFHYMQLKYRTQVLEDMKPFFDSKEITEDTRLKVKAYRQIILTSKKYRFARATYHRYRMENIRSKIIQISPTSWNTAILEEAEKFIMSGGGKKTSAKVFKETLLKTRGKQ